MKIVFMVVKIVYRILAIWGFIKVIHLKLKFIES